MGDRHHHRPSEEVVEETWTQSSSYSRKSHNQEHTSGGGQSSYIDQEEIVEKKSSKTSTKKSSSHSGNHTNRLGHGSDGRMVYPLKGHGSDADGGGDGRMVYPLKGHGCDDDSSGDDNSDCGADGDGGGDDNSDCGANGDGGGDDNSDCGPDDDDKDCGGPKPKVKKIKHFSIASALKCYNLGDDKKSCSVCEMQIVGECYGHEVYDFVIHKTCLDLPFRIVHERFPDQMLILNRNSANYDGHSFPCGACYETGYGFVYTSKNGKSDLHVRCAGSPLNMVIRKDKCRYSLELCYDFPVKKGRYHYCDNCGNEMRHCAWSYYDKDTGFLAHNYCVSNRDNHIQMKHRLENIRWRR